MLTGECLALCGSPSVSLYISVAIVQSTTVDNSSSNNMTAFLWVFMVYKIFWCMLSHWGRETSVSPHFRNGKMGAQKETLSRSGKKLPKPLCVSGCQKCFFEAWKVPVTPKFTQLASGDGSTLELVFLTASPPFTHWDTWTWFLWLCHDSFWDGFVTRPHPHPQALGKD